MLVPSASNPSSDISDLYTAISRQEDKLDSFNRQLAFIANGSLTLVWDGTVNVTLQTTFQHGLGYAPIFIGYYNISTEPGVWRQCDDYRVNSSTGAAIYGFSLWSDANNIGAQFSSFIAATGFTVTFNWFSLREPAQQT